MEIIKKTETELETYQVIISGNFRFIFYYNFLCICIGAGKFSKAIFWSNKINNDTSYGGREDIQCFSRILSLIIHFELKNISLLKAITKSTYRYLHKKKRLYKIESILIAFVRKIYRINNSKKLTEAFILLRKKRIALSKNPYEKKAFDYFDFISWLESKIENNPFAEVVKEKVSTSEKFR